MTKAENILKVVMTPHDPNSTFVDQFLRLLPESDISEFQKILDMKVRNQWQTKFYSSIWVTELEKRMGLLLLVKKFRGYTTGQWRNQGVSRQLSGKIFPPFLVYHKIIFPTIRKVFQIL